MPLQKRPSNVKANFAFGSSACQLAICSINCFGTQLSECAEEVEPKGDPVQLKAMVDQLAGIQMLAGMIAQKGSSPEFVQSMLIGEQMPTECAQFIGKAGW